MILEFKIKESRRVQKEMREIAIIKLRYKMPKLKKRTASKIGGAVLFWYICQKTTKYLSFIKP